MRPSSHPFGTHLRPGNRSSRSRQPSFYDRRTMAPRMHVWHFPGNEESFCPFHSGSGKAGLKIILFWKNMTAFYRFLLHIVFILFRYTIPCRQSSSIQDAISADGSAAQANPYSTGRLCASPPGGKFRINATLWKEDFSCQKYQYWIFKIFVI